MPYGKGLCQLQYRLLEWQKCEKSCRTGKNAHNATSSVAKVAVNQLLTIRNWVIGCYPQICATLSHKLQGIDFFPEKKLLLRKIRGTICETVSRKLQMIDRSKYSINTLSLRIVEKKLRRDLWFTESQIHNAARCLNAVYNRALKSTLIDEKRQMSV